MIKNPKFLDMGKNLASTILQRKNIVHIQLSPDFLKLTILKTSSRSLKLKTSTQITFDNFEYVHPNIFNQTWVQDQISMFLKNHGLYKPKTIVTLPEPATHSIIHKKLIILQAALCMAKTPVKILAISHKTLEPQNENGFSKSSFEQILRHNLLDQFTGYNKNSALGWIFKSIVALGFLIAFLHKTHIKNKKIIQETIVHVQTLTDQTKILKEQIQTLHKLEHESGLLYKKNQKINKLFSCKDNPADLLEDLSRAIPKQSWITKFTLEQKPDHKKIEKNSISPTFLPVTKQQQTTQTSKKTIKLLIEGTSLDMQETPHLVENLLKSEHVKTLKLASLKKVQPQKKISNKKQYQFKLVGRI
ncbi:MAG: PilN domain-containing protein [bacterium]